MHLLRRIINRKGRFSIPKITGPGLPRRKPGRSATAAGEKAGCRGAAPCRSQWMQRPHWGPLPGRRIGTGAVLQDFGVRQPLCLMLGHKHASASGERGHLKENILKGGSVQQRERQHYTNSSHYLWLMLYSLHNFTNDMMREKWCDRCPENVRGKRQVCVLSTALARAVCGEWTQLFLQWWKGIGDGQSQGK